MRIRYPLHWLVILATLAMFGCKPPAESVQVKEVVTAPPDLAGQKSGPDKQALQLRAFQLNHVWATPTGHGAPGQGYRAKITVWGYGADDAPVAELYFHDLGMVLPDSADPKKAARPYQVHFPSTALGPVLGTLRNTNEPVFLYYYDGEWAVGTYEAEPVGVD